MNDQLKQAIIDGDQGVAVALTSALLAGGASARQVLDEALLPGMDVVGARMREGECFIPEVLLSARVMQACLDLLRPHMAAGEEAGMGTVVIGTVEGDLHDIGKNLVGMLLSGAGFDEHRFEDLERFLHRAGGDQHFGNEDLVVLELLADHRHGRNQSVFHNGLGAFASCDAGFHEFGDFLAFAGDDGGTQGMGIAHDASSLAADPVPVL